MGLLGLIVVKILAPGFYARQVMSTPVKIAFATVLVSQTFALILMRTRSATRASRCRHRSARASTPALLFWFLRKRGVYTPEAGWPRFVAKLAIALFVLAAVPALDRRTGVVLARRVAMGEGGALGRRVRRRRRRVFRRLVAAGLSPRRLQSPRCLHVDGAAASDSRTS